MNLLVLRIHRVLRQRLQMFPAAERAQPPDIGPVMYGKVAAVAFAIDGSLGMRRTQLAAPGDGLAVRADQPLRDVEAAAAALRQANHGGQAGPADSHAQPLGLW